MEWLNFRHLYAFWAVCRYGGFRKASQRIFVSQSTVSEQVAQLESYFGETLLDRTTRALAPTERGSALLAFADEIFTRSGEINRIFRDKEEDVPTTIRVGMVGGISRNFVFSRITRTLSGAGGSRMELVDGSFEELANLLRTFELDVMFSLDRPRQADLVTVRHRRVASSPLCVAATPDRLRELLDPQSTEPVDVYLFRHTLGEASLVESLRRRFDAPMRVSVSTDDISLLRFLANGGRGYAVLPQIGVMEDLASKRVESVVLDDLPYVEIFAIYLARGVRRDLVDAFVDVDES